MAYDDENSTNPFAGITSLIPPLPAEIQKNTSETTLKGPTVELSKQGPEMLDAQKQREAATQTQLGTIDQKKEYDQALSQKQLETVQATDAAKEKAEALYKPDLDRMALEVRKAHDDYQKYESPELFHNKSTWEQVLMGVGLALGSFSHAMSVRASALLGRANTEDPVSDIINGDLERQREKIKNLSDKALRAKTGLADRQAALATELAKIDAKGAVAFQRVGLVMDQILKNKGLDQASIEANGARAKVMQDAAAAQQSAVQGLVQHTTTYGKETRSTSEHTSNDTNTTKPPGGGGAVFRDKDGNIIGLAPTARNVSNLSEEQTKMETAAKQIDAYAKFMEAHPGGVWTPTDVAEAKRLRSAADIAVASTSNMGTSDKSTELEAGTLGPTGERPIPFVDAKANPAAVRAKADEIRERAQHLVNRNITPVAPAPVPSVAAGVMPANTAPAAAPLTVVATGKNRLGQRVQKMSDGSIRLAP